MAGGICDALVLFVIRVPTRTRQAERGVGWHGVRRKVDGGLKVLADRIGDEEFFVNDAFGFANGAAGSVLSQIA